jgi:hypothetical protein
LRLRLFVLSNLEMLHSTGEAKLHRYSFFLLVRWWVGVYLFFDTTILTQTNNEAIFDLDWVERVFGFVLSATQGVLGFYL